MTDIDFNDDRLLSGSYDPRSKDIIKFIEKNITTLSVDALTQVCRIIKKYDEKFTAKKDFVLINLGGLKEETIREMVTFIVFIRKNENVLAQDEQLKKKMKSQFDLNDK